MKSLLGRIQRIPWLNEGVLLVLALVAVYLLPKGAPGSVYLVGLVDAAPLVIGAIGVVLVYRANRFINFSQLTLATWTGVLFDGLARGRPLLRALHSACGCASTYPGGAALAANFAVSAVLAVAGAGLVYTLIYYVLIRRLPRSGQLMLSVVTVFLAETLTGTEPGLNGLLAPKSLVDQSVLPPLLHSPVRSTLTLFGYPLTLGNVMLVAAAAGAVLGVTWYLHRGAGTSIRAAGENPGRAQTLGVSVTSTSARVWVLCGLLGGLAGVLGSFDGGGLPSAGTPSIPVEGFVLVLVVVVAARFTNLWVAGLAGAVLGIVQAGVQLSYGTVNPLDASLVVVVGLLFLLQRGGNRGRAGADDFTGVELIRELRPVPRELWRLDQVQRWARTILVVVGVLAAGLPWAMSIGDTSQLSDFVIFALIGVSILIMSGWAGMPALGQFGFGAIGAWAGISSGLPFPFALLIGGLAGAVSAVIVGWPALRLRGLSLAVSSMAFAVSAWAIFINPEFLGQTIPAVVPTPKLFFSLSSSTTYYYVCLVILVAACAATVGLRRSRLGRVLVALRSNEPAAQSFGVSPARARLSAFAVAGFISALAGVLLAYQLGSVAPQEYVADQSLQYFIYAALGGLGGLPGILMGFAFAWILGLLPSNPLLQVFGIGLLGLLIVSFLPGGLAQGVYLLRDSALRRLAFRLRIPVPSLMGDSVAALEGGRAQLGEVRGRARADEPAARYQPPRQWALDRLGGLDTKERVGV